MLVAVQIVDSRAVMMMMLARPGRVMCRKRPKTSAPSIWAASYNSPEIAWSPARNIIAQNGVLAQTTAMTTAHSARS